MPGSNYSALKIVPCPCGSTEPYWHDADHDGIRREYCCDACWNKRRETGCVECGSVLRCRCESQKP